MEENGKVRLAVFDLDGTLADTLEDLAESCNKALETCRLPPHETNSYRYMVGNGVDLLIERAVPDSRRNPQTLSSVKALFNRFYETGYMNHTRPYEGMREALMHLKSQGVTLAVLSNKPDEFTTRMIGEMYGGIFSAVYGGRPGVPKKPDPSALLSILRELSSSPSCAVYIGDSDVDVRTAHNAGMPAIGCAWGFRGMNELTVAGAERVLDFPVEMPYAVMALLTGRIAKEGERRSL